MDGELFNDLVSGKRVAQRTRRIDHDGTAVTVSARVKGGGWSAPVRIGLIGLVQHGGAGVQRARRAHCGGRRRPGARRVVRSGAPPGDDGPEGEPAEGRHLHVLDVGCLTSEHVSTEMAG